MSNINIDVKKKYIIGSILLAGLAMPMQNVEAQTKNVGIGTENPNASALLDLNVNDASFTTKLGLLIPRVALTSTTDEGTILTPSNSLLVYNTATAGIAPNNVVPGFYYWNAEVLPGKWVKLSTALETSQYLPLAGGTMTGAINMGGQDITNIGNIASTGSITFSSLNTAGIVKNNASGVLSSSAVDLASNEVTGTLPIAKGGTGISDAPQNNQVLVGNAANTAYERLVLTAGDNIAISKDANNLNIAATGLQTPLTFSAPLVNTSGAVSISIGTEAGKVAAGDHNHTGVYEPVIDYTAAAATAYYAGDKTWKSIPVIPDNLPPSGTAGGDISGTYPNPTVNKIQGNSVVSGVPAEGQTFKWNTANSQWEYVAAGTVSSVGLTMPAIFNVSTAAITGSGTFGVTLVDQAPNTFLAGPSTGTLVGTPAYRKLDLADLPPNIAMLENSVNEANSVAFFSSAGNTITSNVGLKYNGTTLGIGVVGELPVIGDGVRLAIEGGNVKLKNSELRFFDTGTNSVGFKAPAAADANITYILPATKPTVDGQVLQSTELGVLSWVSSAIVDEGTIEGQTLRFDATIGNTKWVPATNLINDGTNLTISNPTELRFTDGTDNIAFKAPADFANTVTYTLPAAKPTADGQVLTSTQTGELSWGASGGSGSLPDGTAAGQTLRWNESLLPPAWEASSLLRNNGTGIGIGIAPTASEALSILGDVAISTGDLSVGGNVSISTGNLAISQGSVAVAAPIPASGTINVVGKTYIKVTSGDPIILENGIAGQIVILQLGISVTDVTLLSDAGTYKLNGNWGETSPPNSTLNENSTITLIFDGTNWVEIARANN